MYDYKRASEIEQNARRRVAEIMGNYANLSNLPRFSYVFGILSEELRQEHNYRVIKEYGKKKGRTK